MSLLACTTVASVIGESCKKSRQGIHRLRGRGRGLYGKDPCCKQGDVYEASPAMEWVDVQLNESEKRIDIIEMD